MNAGVTVVCRPATAAGFGLAGLAAQEVPQGEDPAPRVEAALANCGPGVLLLEESLLDLLGPDLRVRLERSMRPVVVPFPGPTWTAGASAEERVVELLRRAIGYRVRLT